MLDLIKTIKKLMSDLKLVTNADLLQMNDFTGKNLARTLATEAYSSPQKLSESCSDMTAEMFEVITTVNAGRF